ncbi:hypothetical protein JI664_14275 [Rhodobacter sp. NTK016B]|uniref:hypothetical protein n=1 Tax=Rhodobacter sp. NTK016B TaxID=2759676 RepID=UPI001A8F5B97|nr:hypothetical protein [Rhodobacter sp. NTK016B]MBN8293137.1 hypothetical protein [Rhodobacter sp. NTK016B]
MTRLSAAILATLCLAVPASAQVLPGFAGNWEGDGTLTRAGEPAQTFRCRLRIVPLELREAQFVGRCVTAQGSQSVNYTLTESPDGALVATDRRPLPDTRPAELTGTASIGQLRFSDESGAGVTLIRAGETLRFEIAGEDEAGRVRGAAVLQLRD